jgi:hypothetical protein
MANAIFLNFGSRSKGRFRNEQEINSPVYTGIRPGVGSARPGPDRREAEPRHGAGAATGARTLRPQVPQVSLLHARLHQHQASQVVNFCLAVFYTGLIASFSKMFWTATRPFKHFKYFLSK